MAFEDVSKDGDTAAGSVLILGGPLAPRPSGLRGRVIVPPNVAGWEQVAVMEWELTGERWTDRHPFDEFNYVLDGELHVEVAGTELVAQAGDLVQVPQTAPAILCADACPNARNLWPARGWGCVGEPSP